MLNARGGRRLGRPLSPFSHEVRNPENASECGHNREDRYFVVARSSEQSLDRISQDEYSACNRDRPEEGSKRVQRMETFRRNRRTHSHRERANGSWTVEESKADDQQTFVTLDQRNCPLDSSLPARPAFKDSWAMTSADEAQNLIAEDLKTLEPGGLIRREYGICSGAGITVLLCVRSVSALCDEPGGAVVGPIAPNPLNEDEHAILGL